MHNNQLLSLYTIIFLTALKSLQFLSNIEKGKYSDCCLTVKVKFFGKDITFNLVDCRKPCDGKKQRNPSRAVHSRRQAESHLKTYNSNKSIFPGDYFIKHSQEF